MTDLIGSVFSFREGDCKDIYTTPFGPGPGKKSVLILQFSIIQGHDIFTAPDGGKRGGKATPPPICRDSTPRGPTGTKKGGPKRPQEAPQEAPGPGEPKAEMGGFPERAQNDKNAKIVPNII